MEGQTNRCQLVWKWLLNERTRLRPMTAAGSQDERVRHEKGQARTFTKVDNC